MAHLVAAAAAGASLWSSAVTHRRLMRAGHLAATTGYMGCAYLIYSGYPFGSEVACAIATSQALSSVYMLRTTSNTPHVWTLYYSAFVSFYYLVDSLKLIQQRHRRLHAAK